MHMILIATVSRWLPKLSVHNSLLKENAHALGPSALSTTLHTALVVRPVNICSAYE